LSDANPPPGFVELPDIAPGSFNSAMRPIFVKDEGGVLVGGFRVQRQHTNPNGVCHGGLLATVCDVHMAIGTVYQHGLKPPLLPTISLSLDYLEPIPLGAWVEGRAQLLRAGRRIAFVQEVLTVEGRPVTRASGSFAIPDVEGGDALRASLRALMGMG
jgi:uncharacterized protein (TIGR00369 family)